MAENRPHYDFFSPLYKFLHLSSIHFQETCSPLLHIGVSSNKTTIFQLNVTIFKEKLQWNESVNISNPSNFVWAAGTNKWTNSISLPALSSAPPHPYGAPSSPLSCWIKVHPNFCPCESHLSGSCTCLSTSTTGWTT